MADDEERLSGLAAAKASSTGGGLADISSR
jgi:hypothetical protein